MAAERGKEPLAAALWATRLRLGCFFLDRSGQHDFLAFLVLSTTGFAVTGSGGKLAAPVADGGINSLSEITRVMPVPSMSTVTSR